MAKQAYETKSQLTGNDCMTAFEKMTPEEQAEISSIVRQVIGKLNKRHTGFSAMGMGEGSALELIAKLGIFISQQERTKTAQDALAYLNQNTRK